MSDKNLGRDQANDFAQQLSVNDSPTSRRGDKVFSGVVFQVLKWIIGIVLAVIFIVTVVVITVNRINTSGRGAINQLPLSDEYTAQPPILEWYSGIDEVRGSTADELNQSFVITVHLGYDLEDRDVQTELVARTIQIREIISFYFGSHVAEDLRGVENRQRVKSDLTRRINRILTNGQIRDVAFDQYQILEF